MSEKEYQSVVDRYKFGYLGPAGYKQSTKYCTHAILCGKKDNGAIYKITLIAIALISLFLLIFGCIEQLIVFLFSIAFSSTVSSVLFKR